MHLSLQTNSEPELHYQVIHNPHLNYRRDIDGLRAIAMLSVLIFHAFPNWLHGGFVGVDIFFVISGYLISSIILKAQSGQGFNLLEFYSHRIKRIFPALLVVLIFCLMAGWYILLADEYLLLGKHVAAGAGYVSNIILNSEAGYFDIASELKPLLHLWSLGIEEQFYLVYPLILMLALRANLHLLTVIVFFFVLSFVFNVQNIEAHSTKVFYLAITRSWELLIGGILAYTNLYKRHRFDQLAQRILLRQPHAKDLANVLAWFGILLIVLAIFGLDKSKHFPGWWALFPALGTVCIIAAGEQAWFNQRILGNRAVVYIGLISYPLYLWHWPLLTFARIVEGDTPSMTIKVGALLSCVVLAWATYVFVEKKLRYRQSWIVTVGLLSCLVAVGLLGYGIFSHEGYPHRNPALELLAGDLGSASWEKKGFNRQVACVEKFGEAFSQYCEISDIKKSPSVILIGDSTANHFYPGLAQHYVKHNQNLLNLGQGGCPPLLGINVLMAEGDLQCAESIDKAIDYAITTPSVKTVILSMLGSGYIEGTRSLTEKTNTQNTIKLQYAGQTNRRAIIKDAMQHTLRQLLAVGKQVVFVMSVPRLDFDPATCLNVRPWSISSKLAKSPCSIPKERVDNDMQVYRAVVAEVLHEFPSVQVWDPSLQLCDEKSCWAMKNGISLYRDNVHLSESGSLYLARNYPIH